MISVVYSTKKDKPEFKKNIEETCGYKKIKIIQIENDGKM